MQGFVGESLKTRFFMPCWWVKAFESSFRIEKKLNSWSEILGHGLSPQFNAAEAGLLPTLLTSIQSQLFDSSIENQITISPGQVEKQAGFFPESRKKTLQKVFMGLGGCRLYQKEENGEYLSLPLFQHESWEESSDSIFQIHLKLTREGQELVSGYLDAYEELNRSLQGAPVLTKILGFNPPLMLWRPLWYELQGVEQAVLLNIEKAIQWEQNCFNLEGVFGDQVSNLFAFEAQGDDSGAWGLSKKLHFLAKLTRKLTEHGSIMMLSEKESCVFKNQEPTLQFLWKINPDRFPGMEYGDYTDSVYLLQNSIKAVSPLTEEAWIRSIVPAQDMALLKELDARYRLICDCAAKESLRSQYIVERGNRIIPLTKLYVEWILRQQFRRHDLPVPEAFLQCIGDNLPSLESDESEWKDQFIHFISSVGNNRPFLRMGNHHGPLSVTSDVGSGKILDAFQQKSPNLAGPFRENVPQNQGLASISVKKGDKFTDPKCENSIQKGPERQIQEAKENSDGSVVVPDKKLRAVEKIELLQKSDRDTYLSLIEEYLKSLDDSARQLISDIRDRMQPDIFEQHMQHRLVRFILQDEMRWLS